MENSKDVKNEIETQKSNEETKTNKFIPSDNGFNFTKWLMDCLMLLLGCILKPITYIKTKIDYYGNVKTAGFLVLVVSFARMVINLLGKMISVVFTKQVTSLFSGKTELKVDFSNLGDLNYFSLIFKQFIGFIIVVLAVSGIYYVVSLIFKKNINYFKVATITTVSFVPMIIVTSFISVIIGYISIPLSALLIVGSFIYSAITYVTLLNDELKLSDDMKVYFNSICLFALTVVGYFILKSYIGSVLSLNSLLK